MKYNCRFRLYKGKSAPVRPASAALLTKCRVLKSLPVSMEISTQFQQPLHGIRADCRKNGLAISVGTGALRMASDCNRMTLAVDCRRGATAYDAVNREECCLVRFTRISGVTATRQWHDQEALPKKGVSGMKT
jgi:hypothetical protein